MPPVLGPVSPSPTRLKSWAGARATARTPSQIAITDSSGPVRPSSITTRRPAGPNAAPDSLAAASAMAASRSSVTSTPLPAARPSVLTTHGPGSDRRNSTAGPTSSKTPYAGGRHAGLGQQVLHPGLGALQPGPVRARPEHQRPGGSQPVGQPIHQRLLGADHVQVGLDRLAAVRPRRRRRGRPCRRCPGRPPPRRCGPAPRPGRARGRRRRRRRPAGDCRARRGATTART